MLITGFANPSKSNSQNPQKIALIIAVGNYPASTHWSSLSSAADVELIGATLFSQGFKENDIHIIKNQDATKTGILASFNRMIETANPGDIVFIHFSGHGQQIVDDNEDELDGYDEAFIPVDAQKYYQKNGYQGENHLRDDEIGNFLEKLGEKVAPDGDILVLIDACHSGTGTRGYCPARGTLVRFCEDEKNFIRPQIEQTSFLDPSDNNPAVSLNIISASGANELNYEYIDDTGNSCGSLSFVFSKCLSAVTPDLTYRGLFELITVEMARIIPNQSPQLEGSKDNKILGGRSVVQKPYFKIIDQIDSCTLQVDCGKLFGVFDSSILVFHPVGTIDPSGSVPVAKGYAFEAQMLTSYVRLQEPIPSDFTKSLWGFITHQSLGELKRTVFLDPDLYQSLAEKLREELDQSMLIEYSDSVFDLIVTQTEIDGRRQVNVFSATDQLLLSAEINLKDPRSTVLMVLDVIKKDAQVNLLKKINQKDKEIQVSFELIKEGQPCHSFTVGDSFHFRLVNKGEKKAYYNILDIQPNNIINPILPGVLRTSDECIIESGDTILIPESFRISPPYGKEVMLLIASHEPLNLEFITRTKGGGANANQNPFELLYKESFSQLRSKGAPVNIPPDAVSIYRLVFDICKTTK